MMTQKTIKINLGWAEDDGTLPPWVVNVVATQINLWLQERGLEGGYEAAGPGQPACIKVIRPEEWDVPEVKLFAEELQAEVQRILDAGEPQTERA